MSEQPTTIVSPAASGEGLCVEFRRDGDRFSHTVSLLKGERGTRLLRSSDPGGSLAGPAFQEVHRQETSAGGAIAFLTGMADGRYWSASIESSGQPSARLTIDLACRLKGGSGHVAAAYELGEGVAAELEPDGISLLLNKQPVAVVRPLTIENHPAAQLTLTGHAAVLAPGEGFDGDPRWAFEIVAPI